MGGGDREGVGLEGGWVGRLGIMGWEGGEGARNNGFGGRNKKETEKKNKLVQVSSTPKTGLLNEFCLNCH